jgi:hypothetical protein
VTNAKCPWARELAELDLDRLSKELRRPKSTLTVLAPQNDPFRWTPARLRNAEWFSDLWARFGRPGLHPHGLHYVLVSQLNGTIATATGRAYENTAECDLALASAARDARYLGMISAEDMLDRRNAEIEVNHSNESESADGGITHYDCDQLFTGLALPPDVKFPDVPRLVICPPKIAQRYIVEIWIEKSTMGDVIDPLARRFGVNVLTGIGQTSEIRCRQVIARARATGLPVRILYVSDFDPSGDNMPVAAARKIEFWIRMLAPDLDVQVRPVALTKDQCVEFDLPRTPIKEGERRKDGWEKRHGEGATELDALEALHPGVLGRILTEEIGRYYDGTLQDRIDEVEARVDARLDEINAEARGQYGQEIGELRARHAVLVADLKQRLAEIEDEFSDRFEGLQYDLEVQWDAIADSLDGRFDFEAIDWPEPNEADEDPDPLFDSTRAYVEQIDRYKRHQGKPTERRRAAKEPG